MRRIALILIAMLGLGAVLASSAPGDGGGDGQYLVRAYFDNAGFLVNNEEVRIAGANVGTVDSVDVTRPGEPVNADGSDDPGKAVVVLKITDAGFQDFRTDASCIIRPQSLLGEKFVECKSTEPRSSVSEPPPELSEVPDGEKGAGQRFLPLENNGKAVDLDLVNNITREPESDKFRLILNDLGAGLGARGDTLGSVIERANPALKQTDKVLAILAEQNKGLAQLAADSDAILTPLAREKDTIASFINNANATGEAAAERRDAIEQGFVEFPPALAQLEPTMVELRRFAEQAQPVAADLNVAAPALAGATEALGPFARAGTGALTSLGDAADASKADLIASDPVIKDLKKLAKNTAPGAKSLSALLKTMRKTGGYDQLLHFIVNFGSSINGFDDYGHFQRSSIQINNCIDLIADTKPKTGCSAKWTGVSSSTSAATAASSTANPTPDQIEPSPFADLLAPAAGRSGGVAPKSKGENLGKRQQRAASDLLDYLTEDGG